MRGIALFMGCVFLFACMDTTTKYLSGHFQTPLIVAARYGVNLLLMVAVLAPRHGREMVTIKRTRWVIVRALALSVASITMALAVQRMPVAETSAILFFAPVLVTLTAGPLLGERVGSRSFAAAALGLGGVLLIVRPGSGLDALGVLFAALAMLANTSYQLLSRLLGASERTIALLFYTTLTGTIIFCALAPWFVSGRTPSGFELLLFFSLGVYGGLGHFLFTAAYRNTAASLLAPLNYMQLVFVSVLGWLVFSDLPDALSLTGMGIIAIAGILAALSSHSSPVKRSV
ncbi:DMT family transporter [Sphingomonas turrisvirgatae]|nr:DMT family transporter [Sphingomonas turrisvirgatae]